MQPDTNQAPQAPQAPVVPVKKKRMPRWAIVLISVIGGLVVLGAIFVIVVVTVVNNASAKPLEVSNQFVDAVQADNATAAYALTSSAFQQATSESDLSSIIDSVSSHLTGTEKVTGKAVKAVNGVSQAAIAYSVDNNGTTNYIRVVLQEVGSDWKVVNFKTQATPLSAVIE